MVKGIEYNKQNLYDVKARCKKQTEQIRKDHLRQLNPTPYKSANTKKFLVNIS
jgi:hypothetical protein